MSSLPFSIPASFHPRVDRRPFVLVGVAGLLALTIIVGASVGSLRIPVSDVWAALMGERTGLARVVWNLRLPRVLLAVLVGANLGVAGALLQSVTRNPLAEPNLLGISAGAGLAAVLTLRLDPAFPFARLPVVAVAGALAAAALLYGFAWRGGASPLRLVLAGVAVGALLASFTTFILLTSQITVQTTMAWLSGGLSARTWTHLRALEPYSAVGLLGALLLAHKLDVLALGDDPATGLGLPVQWLRAGAIGIVALLTGSAVAVAGIIGFVGLIVPHLARLIIGPRHGWNLPVSAMLGAVLVVAADAVARTIAAPRELPIGIVTAVAGAPFFLWLLRRAV